MLTLAINTASSHTAIAIFNEDNSLLSENSWKSENNEAEKLLPNIHNLLDNHSFQDISKIIVVKGPGSFTGLRVGVTVANMIAHLNKADLHAIDQFEYYKTQNPSTPALIFAGSGGVYAQTKNATPKLINLPDLNDYLTKNHIKSVTGDISEEQKLSLNKTKFIAPKLSFGKTIKKLIPTLKTPTPLVKPYYIKPPSITKNKTLNIVN